MTDFSQYQSVGTDGNSDPDILLVIPKAGAVDNPKSARVAVNYQTAYARKLGKKGSTLVIMSIDTKNWSKFVQTANADFYQIYESTLAIVPFEGCTNDEDTAKASVEIQKNYLSPKGQKAGCIIFMDSIAQQTDGARTAYRDLPDQKYQVRFALVGGTVFGRAVGSVFPGLSKPRVPTQMFATLEQALTWCHVQVKNN